mmetsp:Transcript_23817/g.34924  ORF Transcript_23817/g.34924 Transcript_23817/m.34924 type:complete len:113 (+) Transcript_23817:92-430(+)|eukprot:CAMPEP_0185019810 /NCGR_PEP_ID=MMETSP1103-20130426/2386_1 /TAXON_ID=36769 /ORGANISM="Paraphysomonas bandaiensis, Strain Caron Lab Isolate" /LENGTH=112 /DNA_ID=CAMNT_0027550299 /DNA_START=60 /DNA_END=398 /DNA_ORIENTATION=-
MKVHQIIFLYSLFTSLLAAQMSGGWTSIDVKDDAVIEASRYSVVNFYDPDYVKSYDVLSASRQVVSGLKYEMIIAIHPQGELGNKCFRVRVVVVDHFGDYMLLAHQREPGDC